VQRRRVFMAELYRPTTPVSFWDFKFGISKPEDVRNNA
jgi:hypothetical protein